MAEIETARFFTGRALAGGREAAASVLAAG
jgi:hypothetical protein